LRLSEKINTQKRRRYEAANNSTMAVHIIRVIYINIHVLYEQHHTAMLAFCIKKSNSIYCQNCLTFNFVFA